MVFNFFQNLNKQKNQVQEEKLTLDLTSDEKVVIHFLNNMDKDFGSSSKGRIEQGTNFEKFLAAAFALANYKVEITKTSRNYDNRQYLGDGGIDLVLTNGSERIAVQAKSKRLNSKSYCLIGDADIKNFSGISDGNWTRKMFITTSFFNEYAYKEIGSNEKAQKIEWYDRYGLLRLLNELIPRTMIKHQLLNTLPNGVYVCPKCKKGIVVRMWSSADKKVFKGCSLYCGYKGNA
ncbi:restriction endonuclease [Enterococcus hirae]